MQAKDTLALGQPGTLQVLHFQLRCRRLKLQGKLGARSTDASLSTHGMVGGGDPDGVFDPLAN